MKRTLNLYLLYVGGSSFLYWMTFTVCTLYYVTVAHLDPLQLVLVGTTLEVTAFLFEVPTGVVADLYSRRLSVLLGLFIVGCAFLLQALVPSFIPILIAQVLWGIGYTFTSGASQAWISDEIGEEHAAAAFISGEKMDNLGSLAGVLAATLLGGWILHLPMILSGAGFLALCLILALSMPEHGFKPIPREERTTFQSMLHILQTGASITRSRPALGGVLAVGFFFGLFSEGFDRLWVAHLVEQFEFPWFSQVTWLGIVMAASQGLSFVTLSLAEKRLRHAGMRGIARTLFAICALLVALLAVFALSRSFFVAMGVYVLIMAVRLVSAPLHTAWVNHRLDSSVRATILSMSGQVDALGQIAGGPLLGVVGREISVRAALLGSSALLSPVLPLFAWLLKNDGETQAAGPEPAASADS